MSRDAMTQLGMVTADIDDTAAVRLITSTSPSGGSSGKEETVTGAQLTLDLIASHNHCQAKIQITSVGGRYLWVMVCYHAVVRVERMPLNL